MLKERGAGLVIWDSKGSRGLSLAPLKLTGFNPIWL